MTATAQAADHARMVSIAQSIWPEYEMDGDALDYVRFEHPALYRLIEQRASGYIAADRYATDRFLRQLPEPLFNRVLVLALSYFRSDARHVESVELPAELCGLACLLLQSERGGDQAANCGEDEMMAALDRFAQLSLIEEQRRAGAFVWINRYSLQARVDDYNPPRIYATDRRTEH